MEYVVLESEFLQGRWKFPPRRHPTPIPTARWDDCPHWVLCVNDEWASHVLGVLEALYQPDIWVGTTAEINDAREQVNQLIVAFMEAKMCCCNQPPIPVIRRVDPETGYIAQISYDGGVTWVTDPSSPSLTAVALPPPVTAGISNTKCDAATNGLQHIKDLVAKQSEELHSGATIAEIALAVAIFIIGLILAVVTEGFAMPAYVALMIGVVAAIANLDAGIFDAYWSSDVYDDILCAFYCSIQDDGSFTEVGRTTAINRIQSRLPNSAARDWLIQILQTMGLTGLNNLCAYGSAADADCSSCDCGCTIDNWEVLHGTEIARGDDWIDVEAADRHDLVGGWVASIRSNGDSVCCYLKTAIIQTGPGPLSVSGYALCGETRPGPDSSWPHVGAGTPSNVLINFTAVAATSDTFTVRFTISDTPT